MTGLENLRTQIDGIDDKIVELFAERMDIAEKIALEKAASGGTIAQPERERQILIRATGLVPEPLAGYARVLMNTLFDLSRSHQRRVMRSSLPELTKRINAAVANTPAQFPESARVACQGITGAYSQLACDKLFPMADIMYFKNFEGVFSAVEKGLCQYGVLPIENSSYGAVNEVYDLINKHEFHIARAATLQISHALLAKPGVEMSGIREIYSHEQALGQCSRFIAAHPEIKINVCENTAVAARIVAESERRDIASISSPECARLYDLRALDGNVRNESSNYTRFICISRDIQIYPGANKISLVLTTEHRPGALYSVIAKLAALGVNISKLESRPIPGRDFEFMFYFDLDATVHSGELLALLGDMEETTEMFSFLGAYNEV